MSNVLTAINLLDGNNKQLDGIIIADTDGADDGEETGLDFSEPEDIDSLPPLTDAEVEETEERLALAFGNAMQVDTSKPVTPEHEIKLANALVAIASMATEDVEFAKKLPLARFIQMNPCPSVGIDRTLEVLEGLVDAGTFRSVKATIQGSIKIPQVTHGTPSSRPS